MSNPELFIDGLLNVTLVKGLVRVDFFSLSATETLKDGQPAPQFRQRLVMQPQALLEIVQSMQVAINALNEKGLLNLKPRPNDPQIAPLSVGMAPLPEALATALPATDPPAADADAPPPRPRSRNFPSTMGS